MKSFDYLVSISPKCKNRYYEVEKMVMYGSSSFYDAMGNLMETYMLKVAIDNNIELENGSSHGKISNALKPILIEKVRMDDDTFKKIKDLSGQINSHKHYNMKQIYANDCVNGLKSFFKFYEQISKYSIKNFLEIFSDEHYSKMFGILSIDNISKLIKFSMETSNEISLAINNTQFKIDKYVELIK